MKIHLYISGFMTQESGKNIKVKKVFEQVAFLEAMREKQSEKAIEFDRKKVIYRHSLLCDNYSN